MRYYHDDEKRVVYSAPDKPDVYPTTDKKGRVTKYSVTAEIVIIRADSCQLDSEVHVQTFDGKDGREFAEQYFMRNHYPQGDEIDRNTYLELRARYLQGAQQN